jgi:hypothetical protein
MAASMRVRILMPMLTSMLRAEKFSPLYGINSR